MYAFSRRKFLKISGAAIGTAAGAAVTSADNPLFRRGNASKGVQEIPTFCDICFLLKAMEFKSIYMLRGGLDDWKDLVLFPSMPSNPSPEQLAAFSKMKEVSKFFGGTPQTGSTAKSSDAALPLPKLQMPGTPTGPIAVQKKKKEGC
jgi:hypothetical protein